jgi:hypothetical protein
VGAGELTKLVRVDTSVTANCLHPGVVATPFGVSSGGWFGRLFPVLKLFFLSPEKGAVALASCLRSSGSR